MESETLDAVLNENRMTVHRRQPGGERYEIRCGHRFALGQEWLRVTSVAEATNGLDATKCGSCFEEAGGY